MTVTVTRLTKEIGGVVDGVDLREPLTDGQLDELEKALLDHLVLFARDQHLTDEQQFALASRFGPVSVYPVARLLGAGPRISPIEDTADSPPDADGWHTDVTWIASPPIYAFLRAVVIPPTGGDTLWASLPAAYERLSPAMQRMCDGLTVRHWYGNLFAAAIERNLGPELVERLRAEHPPVEHPLVLTHPETGRKALFVAGDFMQEIVDASREESDMLLGYLRSRVEDPNVQVRWRWREGDVAIWDERATNHRALSDHYPQHRLMARCTVDAG